MVKEIIMAEIKTCLIKKWIGFELVYCYSLEFKNYLKEEQILCPGTDNFRGLFISKSEGNKPNPKTPYVIYINSWMNPTETISVLSHEIMHLMIAEFGELLVNPMIEENICTLTEELLFLSMKAMFNQVSVVTK